MTEVVLSELTVGLISSPGGGGGGGGGGGAARPPASVSQVGPMSIAEASSRSQFDVSLPSSLPAGFRPVDAVMLEGDFQMTLLAFGSDSGKITLVQAPTGQYQPGTDGKRRYFVVGESLTETSVGSNRAALAEIAPLRKEQPRSYNLVWERGGVLNQLFGHNVSPSDLAATAASIA